MKTYRVVFDTDAQVDVAEFLDDLVPDAGEQVAQHYVDQVIAYCLSFTTFPQRGTRRDETSPGLRTVGWRRRATIAFRVEGNTVTIMRILFRGRELKVPANVNR